MYKKPSSRRIKKFYAPLNLIPILDSVFILIFYLLMSAQFVKIFEIGSDLPIMADSPPSNMKDALNLTVDVDQDEIRIFTTVNETLYKTIPLNSDGTFDLTTLTGILATLKGRYPKENAIVIRPSSLIKYDDLVKILDSVREKGSGKSSIDLFAQIIFGNLGG